MSAGKGDKWRQTDFKKYYTSPLWDNLKNKKSVESEKREDNIKADAGRDKINEQRSIHGR